MKKKILIIEPHVLNASHLSKALSSYEVHSSADPSRAIIEASEFEPDAVILELSLAGHSGLEFLYEFRTYDDWRTVPVIIYSSVQISPQVLNSQAWKQLAISAYLYKPKSSLSEVSEVLKEALHES